MGKAYAGMNGILGALREELIDTSKETKAAIRQLKTTPSGAFGSCRCCTEGPEAHPLEYERIRSIQHMILATSFTTAVAIPKTLRIN